MITQENTRYFKILFRKKYKNMIVNAVVCELNPMHLGHKFIFDSAKATSEDDSVNVAIMSGNFTQRCTPAVFDKYTRAEAAVRCGADIVIELPFPWCSSGVEDFALGGVTIAAALGATRLVFGSERGNIDVLSRVADIKDSEDYKTAVIEAEENSRESGSAVIFDLVMESFGITDKLGANDKLGAEYIRFARKLGIEEFYPIKRISEAKSATELRGIMFSGGIESLENQIPRDAFSVFI
jgi:predicted nucleotidyltransferase